MRYTGLLAACCLLLALPLAAQDSPQHRYRWVDARGHVHLSDALPADSARFGYDLINRYGRVVRHVDGDKTAEEILAAKAEAAAAKEAAAQRIANQRMLLAYPTEADLIVGQKERLQMLKRRMKSTQMSMQTQIEGLARLLEQAAGYAQRGEPVPASVHKDIEHQRQVIRDQRVWIENREAEIAATGEEFADQLARYRELRSHGPSSR